MEKLVRQVYGTTAVPVEFDIDFIFDLDENTARGLQKIFDELLDFYNVVGDASSLGRVRELLSADKEGRIFICDGHPDPVGDPGDPGVFVRRIHNG